MSASGRAERLLQDPAPTSAEIHELVAERLDAVEALFRDNLASPVRIVGEIGSFLAEGGGKRVRPTLHLLASDLVGYRGPHAVLRVEVLDQGGNRMGYTFSALKRNAGVADSLFRLDPPRGTEVVEGL